MTPGKWHRPFRKYVAAALCLLSAACTRVGKKTTATPAALVEDVGLGSSTVLKHPRGEILTEQDLNQDRRTDLWTFRKVVPGPEGRRVELRTREELDLNGDGRVDVVRFYGPDDRLQREAVDLDFDGRVDQLNHYENELITEKERDLNGDGKADTRTLFRDGQPVSTPDSEPPPSGPEPVLPSGETSGTTLSPAR